MFVCTLAHPIDAIARRAFVGVRTKARNARRLRGVIGVSELDAGQR
jgi:hypothetical protein